MLGNCAIWSLLVPNRSFLQYALLSAVPPLLAAACSGTSAAPARRGGEAGGAGADHDDVG